MAQTPVIQKAFNAGYVLEKHQPKLAQQITKGLQTPDSDFGQGFNAGRKQVELERNQNKSKFLEKLKAEFGTPSKPKSKGKDKDFDIER
jgi:hypothetical protein